MTVAGQSIRNWNGKPYHSLDYMLKQTFGEKVYKVTLNGGMSCPNRDGKLGSRGCIFCSAGGSGDFAADAALSHNRSDRQSDRDCFRAKASDSQIYCLFSGIHEYVCTGRIPSERFLRRRSLHPSVVALSIGTRPDCHRR